MSKLWTIRRGSRSLDLSSPNLETKDRDLKYCRSQASLLWLDPRWGFMLFKKKKGKTKILKLNKGSPIIKDLLLQELFDKSPGWLLLCCAAPWWPRSTPGDKRCQNSLVHTGWVGGALGVRALDSSSASPHASSHCRRDGNVASTSCLIIYLLIFTPVSKCYGTEP